MATQLIQYGTAGMAPLSSRMEIWDTLLWCAETKGYGPSQILERLPPINFRAFHSQAEFTRWLFAQPPAVKAPRSILVAGWREAKPCMAAIKAALTGETSGLREDKRRPKLEETHAARAAQVGAAVGAMVVLVDRRSQYDRAVTWLRGGDCDLLPVNVVLGINDLQATLISAITQHNPYFHHAGIPAAAPLPCTPYHFGADFHQAAAWPGGSHAPPAALCEAPRWQGYPPLQHAGPLLGLPPAPAAAWPSCPYPASAGAPAAPSWQAQPHARPLPAGFCTVTDAPPGENGHCHSSTSGKGNREHGPRHGPQPWTAPASGAAVGAAFEGSGA
mmetsp:Transcript_118425/g.313089  ORF Transcript_118425/g.313089 Transcript_118425/m.313089 type:complete len:331 (+) Transcript_118425:26-1018(+)